MKNKAEIAGEQQPILTQHFKRQLIVHEENHGRASK
jgi:hypothetical protein